MTKIAWLLMGSVMVGAICGCGRWSAPGAQIAGTVTLDGKPLPTGNIAFLPTGGVNAKSSMGQIVNGKYEITQESQVLGAHRVDIRADRPTGRKSAPVPSPDGSSGSLMEQYLPKCYNEDSVLTFNLQAGKNVANFDLKTGGP